MPPLYTPHKDVKGISFCLKTLLPSTLALKIIARTQGIGRAGPTWTLGAPMLGAFVKGNKLQLTEVTDKNLSKRGAAFPLLKIPRLLMNWV